MNPNKLFFDFIVVGAGISGSLMAYQLKKAGCSVLLIHNSNRGESTPISSGIINPVTGMRIVKTWNYENIIPITKCCYSELETTFNDKFMFTHQMVVEFNSIEEENNWQLRMADPEYKAYCKLWKNTFTPSFNLIKDKQYGLIENVLRVDLQKVCDKIQNHFMEESSYLEEEFDFTQLDILQKGMYCYKKYNTNRIIFCEGYKVNNNPFYSWLPIVPLKGERMLVATEKMDQMVLHAKYSIVPVKDHYWIGANYSLTDKTEDITLEEKNNLGIFIDQKLGRNAKITNQDFGFRPSSRDRRPILGATDDKPNLYIFNGLGTKGASLAPYCANLLTHHILEHVPLPEEVSVKRFVKKGI